MSNIMGSSVGSNNSVMAFTDTLSQIERSNSMPNLYTNSETVPSILNENENESSISRKSVESELTQSITSNSTITINSLYVNIQTDLLKQLQYLSNRFSKLNDTNGDVKYNYTTNTCMISDLIRSIDNLNNAYVSFVSNQKEYIFEEKEKEKEKEKLDKINPISVPSEISCKKDNTQRLDNNCYILKIAFGETDDNDFNRLNDTIRQKYIKAAETRNILVDEYLEKKYGNINNLDNCQCDAGFDLFVPYDIEVIESSQIKINYNIKCAMFFNGEACGYYLYPRSSTGTKTTLRLSNSVGIIDAGYRGSCMSVFDNISNSHRTTVKSGDRLVQLCAPNITYPLRVQIVNSSSELGFTQRNDGGFGSTGR
jgi:dUTP pyrophosphatase